jgi:hypothetical protein
MRKRALRVALRCGILVLALVLAAPRAGRCDEPVQFGTRIIRHVRVERENVFTADERRKGLFGDDKWLDEFPLGADIRWLAGPDKMDIAGWANRIHFKTRAEVIERELLFKQGDPLKLSLLTETERNLRSFGLLRNAQVGWEPEGDDGANVNVLTQDAWTLVPQVSLSLLGGSNVTGGIGIAEYNLFGFGKAAELFHSSQLYRNLDIVGYNDPRIWGTHWHLLAVGSEDNDGRIRSLLLEYPFYSIEVPVSLALAPSYVVDRERLFSIPAKTPVEFRRIQTSMSASAEYALVATHELVRRVGVRYQEWDDTFTSVPGFPRVTKLGLEDRRTHALELTYTEWWPDFIKAYFLDELGHPEDKDLDFAWALRLGYSPQAIGASANELVLGSSFTLGGRLRQGTYSWLYLQTAGRERAGRLSDSFVTAESIFYQRLPKIAERAQTFVADGRMDLSSGLFRDHEFVAGGDDGGLRGYPVNFIGGTQRMMVHLEDRLMITQDLFHLVSLGGVAFFDAGEVWGRGRYFGGSDFLASVGIGLRAAGTRGRLQIPVRLDFGIPLVHHVGVNAADIATGGGQAFGYFGRPFYAQDNAVSEPENFAPESRISPYPFASPFTTPGPTFPSY